MDVITLGETMAVFSPTQTGKMRYASQYKRTFAGAESNVAIGLANLGAKVSWISQLGDDELGHAIHSFVAGHFIDTSHVTFTSKAPTSLMLKEHRNVDVTNVYYYRKFSAFAQISEENITEELFVGAKILHLTGITPLLSESAYRACLATIQFAKKHFLKIVFDPNLRFKLIENDEQVDRLREIAKHCDYFLPNTHEAKFLYPIDATEPDAVIEQLKGHITATIIFKDGARGTFYDDRKQQGYVKSFDVREMESVGAGDAFAAGFIFGLLQNDTLAEAVLKGNALGAQAIMAEGDIENLPTAKELEVFMNRNGEEDNVNR